MNSLAETTKYVVPAGIFPFPAGTALFLPLARGAGRVGRTLRAGNSKKAPCRRVFRQGRQWDLALHAAPGMKCARIG